MEDVLVVLQLLDDGCQRRVDFAAEGVPVFQETDRNDVLLGLDIEQVVDGNRQVVAPDVMVVDGDCDVFLLLGRIAQQRLHAVAQAPVVLEADGQCGDDDADDERPSQKQQEELDRDGAMEDKREQQEIAEGNEQDEPEDQAALMPDAPRLDASDEGSDDGK